MSRSCRRAVKLACQSRRCAGTPRGRTLTRRMRYMHGFTYTSCSSLNYLGSSRPWVGGKTRLSQRGVSVSRTPRSADRSRARGRQQTLRSAQGAQHEQSRHEYEV
eukprot:scaffold130984_cov72-Phaeocystis_antarctica.AAC.3